MALGDPQLVRIFEDVLDAVDVGAVEHRVDALRVHVERQRHDVDIAGALAIAEQRALDAVGARHQAELGGGDAGAAVVVRMQRDDHVVAIVEVAAHPFDLVGIDVGRRHLDGRRQIEDELVVGGRLMISVTALQISSATSISVPVKLSGEYSKRKPPPALAAMSVIILAASVAICLMPATSFSNTTRRCNSLVEL